MHQKRMGTTGVEDKFKTKSVVPI